MDRTLLQIVPSIVPASLPAKPRRAPKAAPRNPHRGVYLLPPDPPRNPRWRARYRDPESGKLKVATLTTDEARTAELRRDYAVGLKRRIERRREEIRAGARPHTEADTPIAKAIDEYFLKWGARKRARTVGSYRTSCDNFVTWCTSAGVRSVRQLSKGHLRAFTTHRSTSPRIGGTTPLAASSVNRELRNLCAVLNVLRSEEVIRLTRDEIGEGLARLEALHVRREFLRETEIAAVIAACLKHDADADAERPVLGLVLFVLLSGLRMSEAFGIEWRDVGTDEIRVRAEVAKTKRERSIDLSCSPLLAAVVADFVGRPSRQHVLDGWTKSDVQQARMLLKRSYGAPSFTMQALRCTCGTYLTCAPSVFGSASAYMSARRLGHSVTIAERHYLGTVRVKPEARTLDAALGLDALGLTAETCPRL